MTRVANRRLLQIVVAVACVVPISGGLLGIVRGPAMIHIAQAPVTADSHYRFLSGLLLGIGIAFLTTVPRIEQHAARFRVLTAIIVTGGLARLLSLDWDGVPEGSMVFALVMELGVTPALALWQGRCAAAWAAQRDAPRPLLAQDRPRSIGGC